MGNERRTRGLLVLVAELLVASVCGLVLVIVGAGPTAWVMSGILAGAVVLRLAGFMGIHLEPNKAVRKTGQALVGLSLGFSLVLREFGDLPTLAVLTLLTVLLIVGGLTIGYFYARTGETDLTSAMLATMPGGVGIMASVAADYGRHASLVALVQAARIAVVVAFVSFLVGAPLGDSAEGSLDTIFDLRELFADRTYAMLLASAILVTCIAVPVASFLRVPVAALTGAMLVGAAYSNLPPTLIGTSNFTPPELLDVVGQVLLGVTIGEYLGRKLGLNARAIAYGLAAVVATVGVGLIAALIAAQLTDWDWLTCILVTAPGGAPEMIVLALALQQDVEVVTAGQILRQLAINGLLPLWITLFRAMESRYLRTPPR